MKIFYSIFYGFFILLLLGVAGLFVAPLLPIDNNIQIKIVESGSMEPAIMTGSLVLIIPTTNYQLHDIITFQNLTADIPTTHRIVNIEERDGTLWFTTKGDANEEADTDVTAYSNIIGKVAFDVPYAGFILDFARQPVGFAFLIVLPALMIVFGEIEKIWHEIRKRKSGRDDSSPVVTREIVADPEVEVRKIVRMIEIGRPVMSYETITHVRHLTVRSLSSGNHRGLQFGEIAMSLFAVVTSVCFASLGTIGATVSYFNDTEATLNNTFTASAIDFGVVAQGNIYNFTGQTLNDKSDTLVSVVSPVNGSADAHYRLHVEKVVGSDTFCSAVVAHVSSPFIYDGAFLPLDEAPVNFDGAWSLSFSLDDAISGYTQGDECIVDLVYTSWNSEAQEGKGYSDEERVRIEFYAPATQLPVLPEVLGSSIISEPANVPTEAPLFDEAIIDLKTIDSQSIVEESMDVNSSTIVVEPVAL